MLSNDNKRQLRHLYRWTKTTRTTITESVNTYFNRIHRIGKHRQTLSDQRILYIVYIANATKSFFCIQKTKLKCASHRTVILFERIQEEQDRKKWEKIKEENIWCKTLVFYREQITKVLKKKGIIKIPTTVIE